MIQVMYQNIDTGAAHDITTLITEATWKTVRKGAPAQFDFTMINDKNVNIIEGGIIAVKTNSLNIFHGYVFKDTVNHNGEIDVLAYDQMRYLKNKETYVFTGKRADQIVTQIAADFKIILGQVANTMYVINSLVMDSKTLFDTILEALDRTLMNKGEMFYLWDDYGSLRVSNVKDTRLNIIIGDDSLITEFDRKRSIDSDTFNRIKLVKDNKDTGRRDVYIAQDSDNMKRWGILQHHEVVNSDMNKAQVDAQAKNMLKLMNRPTMELSMEGISDLNIRAGRSVFVKIKSINMSGWYIIESCTHDLLAGTMSLEVRVV